MNGDHERRLADRLEHQQNESANVDARRQQGSHWAPIEGAQYQSPPAAAAAGVKHNVGGYEDPSFRPDPTVPEAATRQPVQQLKQNGHTGLGAGPQVLSTSRGIETLCGPLLNYRRMSKEHTDNPIWHGSILVVTTPGQSPPELRLRIVRTSEQEVLTGAASYTQSIRGEKLFEDPKSGFWRFTLEIPFQSHESVWEYNIPNLRAAPGKTSQPAATRTFAIPAKNQSMRIMFHSCNGFSAGTDTEAWSGCALWNDVMRVHGEKPFHVMIGGGDQVYNDGVGVDGPLASWTDMSNPKKRRDFPFNEELRAQCDDYYFKNYVRWYGIEPFATANGQIPQLNIWDDHDIIDGFGSYTDHFMKCAVFRGIGGIAHKYYLLFQHHMPPPKSTFTTDAPATFHADASGTTGVDSVQLKNTWVMTPKSEDPSFIIGKKPGPYVEERSRSIYCQLGARMAFIGIDARTERTRHQVNYPQTYDDIFNRANKELAASNGAIQHLILLLGVPIAYPRLQWLENILQSPIIGPIRFLNKRFGVAGNFFNHFDGGVDLMDDLDDHYTAHQHKKERKMLVQRLQTLARDHSIRISILGGDVHLAALGRFYSNPKLSIQVEQDWRYMANIISSAITNKPPPQAVANLLAKRNKVHHLDHDTDETLLYMFDKDPSHGKPNVKSKSADSNHCTMPSRNYAIIDASHIPSSGRTNGTTTNGANGHAENGVNGVNGYDTNGTNSQANGVDSHTNGVSTNGLDGHTDGVNGNHRTYGNTNGHTNRANGITTFPRPSNPRNALHAGEAGCGTTHPAASGVKPSGLGGAYGLDVTIRVEISASDKEGHTQGYGFSIPALEVVGGEKSKVGY